MGVFKCYLKKNLHCHPAAVLINHWQMIANVLNSQYLKRLISSTFTQKAICCNYTINKYTGFVKPETLAYILSTYVPVLPLDIFALESVWILWENGNQRWSLRDNKPATTIVLWTAFSEFPKVVRRHWGFSCSFFTFLLFQ